MNTTTPLARLRPLLAAALLIPLAACGGGDGQQQAGGQADAADATETTTTTTGDQAGATTDAGDGLPTVAEPGAATTIAGIRVTPPAAWEDLGPSGMRKAQYEHPPVGDDTAPAEVNVFYFGPQSGGGVEANLQRWIGQMAVPDGDPGAAAERSTFTADGMAGHVVALDGTYQAGGMGGGDASPRPGHRLVGVVLEGPQGSVFFKLTGPEQTARVMEEGLMAMVKAARKAG
jgi:hypothetical protein